MQTYFTSIPIERSYCKHAFEVQGRAPIREAQGRSWAYPTEIRRPDPSKPLYISFLLKSYCNLCRDSSDKSSYMLDLLFSAIMLTICIGNLRKSRKIWYCHHRQEEVSSPSRPDCGPVRLRHSQADQAITRESHLYLRRWSFAAYRCADELHLWGTQGWGRFPVHHVRLHTLSIAMISLNLRLIVVGLWRYAGENTFGSAA